jgi:hypothetical protein
MVIHWAVVTLSAVWRGESQLLASRLFLFLTYLYHKLFRLSFLPSRCFPPFLSFFFLCVCVSFLCTPSFRSLFLFLSCLFFIYLPLNLIFLSHIYFKFHYFLYLLSFFLFVSLSPCLFIYLFDCRGVIIGLCYEWCAGKVLRGAYVNYYSLTQEIPSWWDSILDLPEF